MEINGIYKYSRMLPIERHVLIDIEEIIEDQARYVFEKLSPSIFEIIKQSIYIEEDEITGQVFLKTDLLITDFNEFKKRRY